VVEQVVPAVPPALVQSWLNVETTEVATCEMVQTVVEPEVSVHERGVVPVPPELLPELPPLLLPELLPLLLPEPEPLPPPLPPLLVSLHWLLHALQALAWLEMHDPQSDDTLLMHPDWHELSPAAHAQKQLKYELQVFVTQVTVDEQLLCAHDQHAWLYALDPWHEGPLNGKLPPPPLLLLEQAKAAIATIAEAPIPKIFFMEPIVTLLLRQPGQLKPVRRAITQEHAVGMTFCRSGCPAGTQIPQPPHCAATPPPCSGWTVQ
jgi:hypothetical protein